MNMRVNFTMPPPSAFVGLRRDSEERIAAALLKATDHLSRSALNELRNRMSSAGLGRLGYGLGQYSDLQGRGVYRRANGFSASGTVFIRASSKRTRGAIEAYTEGANISPRRGRWLWIATNEIPKKAGRFRMTPALYNKNGFDTKIGPLVTIKGINGYPLKVVRDATVSAAGLKGKARSRTKSGGIRKGQREKATIVAFFAIPYTSRGARVNVQDIGRKYQQMVVGEVVNLLGVS